MISARAGRSTRAVTKGVCCLLIISAWLGSAASGSEPAAPSQQQTAPDSVVVRWNQAFLQGVRESKLGPPMASRALAIGHTCIYDAWAAYDAKALGTRLGGELRRPVLERTLPNIKTAVSLAAYRAAVDLFPGSQSSVFDPLMAELGYDPANTSTDTSSAAGVGNRACQAVLEFRHHDGSNQLGDEPGGAPGVAYSDYTGYTPVNQPMDLSRPFDPTSVTDPNRWQPLTYTDATGAVVTPKFIAPFWTEVTPFAMSSGSQERSPTGPARYPSDQYAQQARQLVNISAKLDDTQKMVAEYWADGPHSELPPGHWDLFAQWVARRDRHGAAKAGVEADVKMFFALTNAVFDAGITAWDDKMAFDSERPITAVRYLLRGQKVRAWGGPFKGTQLIDGSEWLPYQPSTFPTPPFAEYSSGHSNFSAAGAELLRLATGSDHFGASVTLPPGSSRVEPGAVPASPVTLTWSTFSNAAEQAGISRRYGGIHFQQGDLEARATGKQCADQAWGKAQALFTGSRP